MNIKSPLKKSHWPWPKMDVAEVANQACRQNIFMPNIGYIHVEINNGWLAETGDAANSKRLWLNSLVSAHACLTHGIQNLANSTEFIEVAFSLLKSYLQNYQSDEGIFKDAWRDEHAVANRLFVITAFLHYSTESSSPIVAKSVKDLIQITELLKHATLHAEWLDDDIHYVKNNHGVMMDLSLAQYSKFLINIDKSAQKRYSETSSRRLEMMLDRTFDKDGCCTENSTTYHFVNYSLFSTILELLADYDLVLNKNRWKETLEKARIVGNLLLRSDGTIPLIGDSETKLGTFFPNPRDINHRLGVGYYPDAGLFVASLSDINLTFKAGGMSYSHRHIDDLSITLRAHCKDFIIDSGLYNYDISDRMRRWFLSSKSHSGFYLESQGDVRFANFESPLAMSNFEEMESNGEFFMVRAVHNLSKETVVNRKISYTKKTIVIEDSFAAEIEQNWRAQFLLHPDVEITKLIDGNGFVLSSGNEKIILNIIDLNLKPRIEKTKYSPTFMKIISGSAIILQGVDRNLSLRVEILI